MIPQPQKNSMQSFKQTFSRSPGVMTMMVIQVITFLLLWSGGVASGLVQAMMLIPSAGMTEPWRIFTNTFVSGANLINVAFGCLWLWFAGRPVEEELGTRNWWLAVLGFVTAISLCLVLGTMALRPAGSAAAIITGFAMVNAVLTCLWAARRPTATILFFGIVPVQLRWIALLSVALIIFTAGFNAPLVGFITALPLLVAWLWAGGKLPVAYPTGSSGTASASSFAERKLRERQAKEFEEFRENVKVREKERAERERLKKLFEDLSDDDGAPRR